MDCYNDKTVNILSQRKNKINTKLEHNHTQYNLGNLVNVYTNITDL